MTEKKPKNVAASIQQRLRNHAQENGKNVEAVLSRYGVERFLYRISKSKYKDKYCLKGSILFIIWKGDLLRPTRDADFLSFGTSEPGIIKKRFQEICLIPGDDDGIEFDPESVTVEEIREAEEYDGVRVTLRSSLGKARIRIQIDIGFGDVITPDAVRADYPTVLESSEQPSLLTYPKETVVAEKFEAAVKLGVLNSRMKDFYDLWLLQSEFSFEGQTLANAIHATFERRQTDLPTDLPIAFTDEFIKDETKLNQWRGFVGKGGFRTPPPELEEVVELVKNFLMPLVQCLNRTEPFPMYWPPGGQWHADTELPKA